MSWQIRDCNLALDSNKIAALVTELSTSAVSGEEFKQRVINWPKKQPCKRRVAEQSGSLVAYCRTGQYAPNPKNAYTISLFVDKSARNQGVGSALLKEAVDFVEQNRASAIVVVTYESDKESTNFAQKRQFEQAAKLFDSYLDLTTFDQDSHIKAIEEAAAIGYRLAALSEFELSVKTKQAVFEVFHKADRDIPGIEYFGLSDQEQFEIEVFEDKTFDPNGTMIAMKDDVFVGYSNVYRTSAAKPGDVFTGFTGVDPAHRGKGVAYAMKVKGIQYCLQQGFKRLKTENDTRNAPMIAVNKKLGFVEYPGEVMFVRNMEECN